MSDLMKEIGERIKHYRKAKGMTQKELGEKVGCHEGTIRQYENGLREPRKVSKLAIARALDVSYDRLFSQKDGTNLAQLGTDCISRQAAIEALFDWEMNYDWDDHCREEDPKPEYIVSPSDVIKKLPSAEEESFEWCTDCKEYDQEAHCCHRWSKMIRKTVDEMQIVRCKDCKYAEYIDDVQTLWCTECGQGRTVAPYDFCSYGERRDNE